MVKKIIKKISETLGYQIVKINPNLATLIPDDIKKDSQFREILRKCKPYTMTSIERMYALYQAIEYIVEAGVEGDFVECGVWKGGSSMLMALTLLKLNETKRFIYLYDTYAGMTEPTAVDVNYQGVIAIDKYQASQKENINEWAFASLEEVKSNLVSTHYPSDKLGFVRGKVEETIPSEQMPQKIALLRLDTDWYESTLHELKHLFPLLSQGGILIIDDYGSWQGSRKATDEFFAAIPETVLLHRIDGAGRLVVKP